MNIELQVKNLFANADKLDEAGFVADFYYIAKEYARQQNGAKPIVMRSVCEPNHHNLDVLHLGCCSKCGGTVFKQTDA